LAASPIIVGMHPRVRRDLALLRETGISAPLQVSRSLYRNEARGGYARWHMFEEKREAVMAIEAAVLLLMQERFPPILKSRRSSCA
jgi:hypothetical protein